MVLSSACSLPGAAPSVIATTMEATASATGRRRAFGKDCFDMV